MVGQFLVGFGWVVSGQAGLSVVRYGNLWLGLALPSMVGFSVVVFCFVGRCLVRQFTVGSCDVQYGEAR